MIELLLGLSLKMVLFAMALLWFLFCSVCLVMLLGIVVSIVVVIYDVYKESKIK